VIGWLAGWLAGWLGTAGVYSHLTVSDGQLRTQAGQGLWLIGQSRLAFFQVRAGCSYAERVWRRDLDGSTCDDDQPSWLGCSHGHLNQLGQDFLLFTAAPRRGVPLNHDLLTMYHHVSPCITMYRRLAS
jgi:hypothetical protein